MSSQDTCLSNVRRRAPRPAPCPSYSHWLHGVGGADAESEGMEAKEAEETRHPEGVVPPPPPPPAAGHTQGG